MPSFVACTEGVGETLEMFRHSTTAGTASVHCEYEVKAHAYRHACLNFLSEIRCDVSCGQTVAFLVASY